ncbi:MAG: GAF domain-containing protein [Methylacidiphilales bacterium]|nr:GAF domain-containing protein [Candidatus Methylacidiphilales bacterium]
MNAAPPASLLKPTACDLESVIATSELKQRKTRTRDRDAENQAELELTQELAKSPHDFFQKLVNMVLKLSMADSAGISLLDEKNGRFVWPAVAGGLSPFLGGGTPRSFGPCGTVLDRNEAILFLHPERHFTYLEPITPPLEEVLLIPFHVEDKPVGTIWAVIHNKNRKFQLEDRRLLENLSAFASSAFKVLVSVGALESLLGRKPDSESVPL